VVIPHERAATPDRAKAAPALRVAPKMGPCRVARCLFGITKLCSSRLAWLQFWEQRVDHICINRPLPLSPYIFPICASKSSKSVLALAGSKLNRCFAIEHLSPAGCQDQFARRKPFGSEFPSKRNSVALPVPERRPMSGARGRGIYSSGEVSQRNSEFCQNWSTEYVVSPLSRRLGSR
jgi:hypothetical protein